LAHAHAAHPRWRRTGGERSGRNSVTLCADSGTSAPLCSVFAGRGSSADPREMLISSVFPRARGVPRNFEAQSAVAYLRSLPPVDHKVPGPVYKMQIPLQVFPGAEKPMSESDLDDKLKRGFYLVTIAHCMACHTPFGPPATGIDFKNSLGKGGREFPGPWGVSTSRNITSSKSAGIGDWSDADVKRAITQGVRKDGTKLKPPMGYP